MRDPPVLLLLPLEHPLDLQGLLLVPGEFLGSSSRQLAVALETALLLLISLLTALHLLLRQFLHQAVHLFFVRVASIE